jgi:hypothetical protein
MVWWLAAIPIVGALKLGYDYLTEDDSSSSETNDYPRHLATQRGLRTRQRKKLLIEIVTKQTNASMEQIENILEVERISLGDICLKKTSDCSGYISHEGINKAIVCLDSVLGTEGPKSKSIAFKLNTWDLDIKGVVKRADKKYGSFAGLNDDDYYAPELDPFVTHLNKILKEISNSSK